ncbi:hypothetical protein K466DRAFT_598772 [Polyporus arcularius HHB13444]|uniref:Uncharacterized protein n=1 Tax=Polyporus arcularius HHB13444 TaxID=1314778 RepID=A0A5C3PIV2_9APHY|nr:hypothetical protein K466DRAFT_598772 [Polyporus arcularius HHB13444]
MTHGSKGNHHCPTCYQSRSSRCMAKGHFRRCPRHPKIMLWKATDRCQSCDKEASYGAARAAASDASESEASSSSSGKKKGGKK